MPSGRTNNFPESGRGLGHVTPTTFDIRSNISPKLLELETSNLVGGFVLGMPSRRTNNFPRNWAWPRSRDPYNFWQYQVGYPSDSLASCYDYIWLPRPFSEIINRKRRHIGIRIIIRIIYFPINGYPDSKLSVLSIPMIYTANIPQVYLCIFISCRSQPITFSMGCARSPHFVILVGPHQWHHCKIKR